jgi:cobalt-precorrin-5B (C1)-methyltransferase
MIKTNLQRFDINGVYHIAIEVKNGKEIAKQTANEKVGVIGGISILGTTGIVKPVSSKAYLKSIEAEISVASNYCDELILTLGNSAYKEANSFAKEACIIEIGNYIYDSLKILQNYNFKNVIFITSIAKMTKVSQGIKNTHNRFGGIDFEVVYEDLKQMGYIPPSKPTTTLKAILDEMPNDIKKRFYDMIEKKAQKVLEKWYKNPIKTKVLR